MVNENGMPFGKKMKIELKSVSPTKITANELKEELNSIGLSCAHTEAERLEKYIEEVVSSFKKGKNQGFGTFRFPKSEYMNDLLISVENTCNNEFWSDNFKNLSINNEWEIIDPKDYAIDLATIVYSENFDFLKEHYNGFIGNKKDKTEIRETATPIAIKDLFENIANELTSNLIDGVTPETTESFLAHIIQEMPEESRDYYTSEERFMFLVKGYNPDSKECDSVGVISCKYEIKIEDYKSKKDKHLSSQIHVEMRSFVSSDSDYIKKLAEYVRNNKKNTVQLSMLPFHSDVKVFDTLPEANSDTFANSIPLESKNDIMSAMVLYAPDLENIGVLDNSDSDATSQYSKTITSGFTFSTTEKIGSNISYEIGCNIAKLGISVNMEMSMTEQWNESQSETISFTVPGRQKVYLYQCYIHAAVLYYDLKTFKYYYQESGRFLTNMVKTSDKSLITK